MQKSERKCLQSKIKCGIIGLMERKELRVGTPTLFYAVFGRAFCITKRDDNEQDN